MRRQHNKRAALMPFALQGSCNATSKGTQSVRVCVLCSSEDAAFVTLQVVLRVCWFAHSSPPGALAQVACLQEVRATSAALAAGFLHKVIGTVTPGASPQRRRQQQPGSCLSDGEDAARAVLDAVLAQLLAILHRRVLVRERHLRRLDLWLLLSHLGLEVLDAVAASDLDRKVLLAHADVDGHRLVLHMRHLRQRCWVQGTCTLDLSGVDHALPLRLILLCHIGSPLLNPSGVLL